MRPSSVLLVLSLICAIGIRICFFFAQHYIYLSVDGYEYYDIGYRFTKGITFPQLINPYRSPAYPFVISYIMKPSHPLQTDQTTPNFYTREQYLMFIQHLSGIGSVLCLFFILRYTQLRDISRSIIVFLYGIYTPLVSMERGILTEPFSTLFLMLSVLFLLKAQSKPTMRMSHVGFMVTTAILFLFRPFYVLLPLVLAITTGIYSPSKKRRFTWVVVSISTLLLPAIFFLYNHYHYGFDVVNQTSSMNILGRIIQFPLQLPSSTNEERSWSESISRFRSSGAAQTPYAFVSAFISDISVNPKAFRFMQRYTTKTIQNNALSYLYYSFRDIPKTLTDDPLFPKYALTTHTLSTFFISIASVMSRGIHLLNLLLIPAGVVWCIHTCTVYIKKHTLSDYVTTIFVIIMAYAVVVAVTDGYEDFGRLCISTIGIAMLLTVMVIERMVLFVINALRHHVSKIK